MPVSVKLVRELEEISDPKLRKILFAIMEEFERQREESITKKEFLAFAERTEKNFQRVWEAINRLTEAQKKAEDRLTRLEAVVQKLAEAQKKTEQRLTRLEATVQELAEAQKKTEQRLNELAEAQKKTEDRLTRLEKAVQELTEAQKKAEDRLTRLEATVQELAEAQKKTEQEIAKLTRGLEITRQQLGGLTRSVSYALENEAYRYLPKFLKVHYGIEVIDRLIRTFIRDREINIFGRVRRNGKELYLVGDAVLKLDDISKLRQIWDQVGAVKEEFGGEVIPILITHFAKPDVLAQAQKAGILVVQSFEWI